jgi:hypothetical protein
MLWIRGEAATHCEVRVEVAACFESRDEGAACSGARIMNNKQLWH